MIVRINDGTNEILNGTPAEIVAQFHNGANMIGRCESDQLYIESVASRLEVTTGLKIRSESHEKFIYDLALAGMFVIIKN